MRNPDLFNLPRDPDEEFEAAYREGIALLAKSSWEVQILSGKATLEVYRKNPHYLADRTKLLREILSKH